MEKVDFKKQMAAFFRSKGFFCKSNHYYKNVSSDILIVFGIYMSCYGGYCYLEHGYCFKSINKYLPYPKFNQLNLNCGRIMMDMGQAIVFEKLDEDIMSGIKQTVDKKIDDLIDLVELGRDGMIKFYLSEMSDSSWYILGDETADYFGLPKEAFRYHYVKGA